MEIAATVLVVVFLTWLVATVFGRRRASKPRRVDEYVLSVEEREGFPLVHMRVKTEDGAICTFELEPAFGHVLSDELCTTAAHAMKTKSRSDHAASH